MANLTNIRTELETFIPAVKADFIRQIERDFEQCKDMFNGRPNCYDRRYRRYTVVRGYTYAWNTDRNERATSYAPGQSNIEFRLNEERIEKHADQYATDQIDAFIAKLEKKLGDLTDIEIIHLNAHGFTFTLRGKLGDHDVEVHQQVVFKMSSAGTPYVQWPARIYVDGKFTSEAAFKKLA